MQDKRSSAVAVVIALLLLIIVCAGSYVGGYSFLCTEESEASYAVLRVYRYHWLAQVFRPAAAVDSWLRGTPVETMSHFAGATT